MSGVGNDSTFGNLKSNYHFQLSLLQILQQVANNTASSGSGGVGYEFRTTTYKATATVNPDYTTGDIISRTDIINPTNGVIASTLWFNETGGFAIGQPPQGNLTPFNPPANVSAQGDVANGSTDSGNPVKTGGLAKTADPAAVTDGQRVNALYTKLGKQVEMPYSIPENFVSGATSDITNTAATTIIAGVASNNLYITHIVVMNSHATTGTWVNLTEETTNTILYTVYAAPAGGGASVTLPVPLKVPTAGKALQATCVTTSTNVRVSASGYKSA